MRSTRRVSACLASLALGLAAGGCGAEKDDLPRQPVSGKVTLEGTPIAKGAILFKPSGGPGPATDAGGLIRDGEYRIDRDAGPVPGTYKVLITEEVERSPIRGNDVQLRPPKDASRISSKYNTRTTLAATVKPGESNTFDFALKKADDREQAARPKGRRR